MGSRDFDVVLLGATGFVGRLTARHLAARTTRGQRVALAGRDLHKVESLRRELIDSNLDAREFACVQADSTDPISMDRLARRTRVLATAVGPYLLYGEQVVRACAAAGTDYLDLTGEPEFVDTMFVRHDAAARRTGARLVHACGFDSVPHDLGAWFTVQRLPEGVPISVRGYVQASGAVSGGTARSALNAFARTRSSSAVANARRAAESRPADRSAVARPARPHRPRIVDGFALPLPTIDPRIVARSARAIPRYGPHFRYSHFAVFPDRRRAAAVAVATAGVIGLAQLPPVRRALMARNPPGSGPDEDKRRRSWFRVTFVGEGGGRRVVTRVSGGDPGYGETARMFGEAALCLAFDERLPDVAGQVTTVQAMGDALLDRVQQAGLRVEVLSAGSAGQR